MTEWDMELALHANLISPICQTDFRAVDRYILLHSGEPYQTRIITKTSPSIYSFPSLKQVSNQFMSLTRKQMRIYLDRVH